MGNESTANAAFVAGLHGRPIRNIDEVRRIADFRDPQNQRLAARGGLYHAGLVTARSMDDWLKTSSREEGSGLYCGIWSHGVIATIDSPQARLNYEAWLAWNLIVRCKRVEKIQMDHTGGTSRRPRSYGRNKYRGPIPGCAGNRFIWDRGTASFYHELHMGGPLVERALGNPYSWGGQDHHVIGWPYEAATKHDAHRIRLTEDIEDLVAKVAKVPCRRGVRFEAVRFADDSLFTLMSATTHSTRGGVMATLYEPRNRLLRVISPATPRGGGEWTACNARLEGRDWSTWQRGSPTVRLEGRLRGDIVHHVVWDQTGCRLAGDSVPPPDPPPIDPPPTGPPTGGAIDQAIGWTYKIQEQAALIEPQDGVNRRPVGKIGRQAAEIRRLLRTV